MRFLFIVFAAVLAALVNPAFAGERTFRQGADEVRTFDTPCMHPVVLAYAARLVPDTEFQKAYAVVGGQRYEGCWRAVQGGAVHLIYEDGDQGILPEQAFTEAPSA